jgi:predicted transcriptional regulator
MSTVKEDIQALIERLPDDCTLEDIQYHLYVLEKIRGGIEDAETGRVKTQEEVEAKFAEWLTE